VNRFLIAAVAGVLAVIIAIVFNFILEDSDESVFDKGRDKSNITNDIKTVPENIDGEPTAIIPAFDVVRVDAAGNTVMAGRAEPNAIIVIYDNGNEVSSVQADGRGEWVFVSADPFESGSHEFSLMVETKPDHNVLSSEIVIISIPETGDDILIVKTDRDGGNSRVLQSSAEFQGRELSVETIDYDGEGKVFLSGRARAGNAVQIYLDNAFAGSARVQTSGFWSLESSILASLGEHQLRADEVSKDMSVLKRIELSFVRRLFELGKDQTAIAVVKGNSLWSIARRIYGRGVMYTLIYEANRQKITEPDLIYPGQIFTVPTPKAEPNLQQ